MAADKNEILFSRFGINYNNEPDMFKKGSVTYQDVCCLALPADIQGLTSFSAELRRRLCPRWKTREIVRRRHEKRGTAKKETRAV